MLLDLVVARIKDLDLFRRFRPKHWCLDIVIREHLVASNKETR